MASLLQQLENNEAILLMYLADELGADDRREVEQMLRGDAGLAAELDELRAAQNAVMAAIGAKHHMQLTDTLGPAQIIEAVPEKFGPAPARNDQYVAVLGQRICHGASVLRPATRQDAARRRSRPGRWQLVDCIRHRAWCWSRHELDWSFGT